MFGQKDYIDKIHMKVRGYIIRNGQITLNMRTEVRIIQILLTCIILNVETDLEINYL